MVCNQNQNNLNDIKKYYMINNPLIFLMSRNNSFQISLKCYNFIDESHAKDKIKIFFGHKRGVFFTIFCHEKASNGKPD